MFASAKICFVVGRDRTPNAATDRGERESGSHSGQHDTGMPCGDCGRSLADRQLHRERKISRFDRHLHKIKPSTRSECQSVARRFASPESRPHYADQKGVGNKTETEEIIFTPRKFLTNSPGHSAYHIWTQGNTFIAKAGGGAIIEKFTFEKMLPVK